MIYLLFTGPRWRWWSCGWLWCWSDLRVGGGVFRGARTSWQEVGAFSRAFVAGSTFPSRLPVWHGGRNAVRATGWFLRCLSEFGTSRTSWVRIPVPELLAGAFSRFCWPATFVPLVCQCGTGGRMLSAQLAGFWSSASTLVFRERHGLQGRRVISRSSCEEASRLCIDFFLACQCGTGDRRLSARMAGNPRVSCAKARGGWDRPDPPASWEPTPMLSFCSVRIAVCGLFRFHSR